MKLEIVKIPTNEFVKNLEKDKLFFLQTVKNKKVYHNAYYNGKKVGEIYDIKPFKSL